MLGNTTTAGRQVLLLLVELAFDPPQSALSTSSSLLDFLEECCGVGKSLFGTGESSICSSFGVSRCLASAFSLLAGGGGLSSSLFSSLASSCGLSSTLFSVLASSSGLGGCLFGCLASSSGLSSSLLSSLTCLSGRMCVSISSLSGLSSLSSSGFSNLASSSCSSCGLLSTSVGSLQCDLGTTQRKRILSQMLCQLVLGTVHRHNSTSLRLGL